MVLSTYILESDQQSKMRAKSQCNCGRESAFGHLTKVVRHQFLTILYAFCHMSRAWRGSTARSTISSASMEFRALSSISASINDLSPIATVTVRTVVDPLINCKNTKIAQMICHISKIWLNHNNVANDSTYNEGKMTKADYKYLEWNHYTFVC